MKMDKEEKALLNAYERGEMKSVPKLKRALRKYSAYAKTALSKKNPKDVSNWHKNIE